MTVFNQTILYSAERYVQNGDCYSIRTHQICALIWENLGQLGSRSTTFRIVDSTNVRKNRVGLKAQRTEPSLVELPIRLLRHLTYLTISTNHFKSVTIYIPGINRKKSQLYRSIF